MRFFYQLSAIVIVTLLAVLGWDLSSRRVSHGNKELIIYAGMFGPGEPVQLLYSGPPAGLEPEHPFGAQAMGHYAALMAAWPEMAAKIEQGYQSVFRAELPNPDPAAGDVFRALAEQYRQLNRRYIDRLVAAIGKKDRLGRLGLFNAFAELHPQFDLKLIHVFEQLHPAYTVGLFEDFKRRHPQYAIEERWDGRWVLSTNRPRFLTGTDVPDLIAGSLAELRILFREDLALPLDQPLPKESDPVWRSKGILYSASADGGGVPVIDTFNNVALEACRYTISARDVRENHHPYPAGTRIAYLWPGLIHINVIFYNRAHFRQIGLDPDSPPKTVDEFEDTCRKLLKAGIEPIAQDGESYLENWWLDLSNRTVGYDELLKSCSGYGPRFAGPDADKRYVEIAKRLRRWRDEGFWMKQFSASKWPGAQRDFGAGKCTFLFTGTWLPAEIAQTRSYDPKVFDLSCFVFPACPEGTGNPRAITASAQGHAITRQGRNHKGAAALLNYLSTYGAELEGTELHYISARKGVALPPEMAALGPILAEAKSGDIITDGILGDLPMFTKFVLLESVAQFMPVRSDNLTPEEFCETMERKAQQLYAKYGKGM